MTLQKMVLATLALFACATASADFGVGVKAGTLGLGAEARWSPLPWLDFRVGANSYDYEDNGAQAGIITMRLFLSTTTTPRATSVFR